METDNFKNPSIPVENLNNGLNETALEGIKKSLDELCGEIKKINENLLKENKSLPEENKYDVEDNISLEEIESINLESSIEPETFDTPKLDEQEPEIEKTFTDIKVDPLPEEPIEIPDVNIGELDSTAVPKLSVEEEKLSETMDIADILNSVEPKVIPYEEPIIKEETEVTPSVVETIPETPTLENNINDIPVAPEINIPEEPVKPIVTEVPETPVMPVAPEVNIPEEPVKPIVTETPVIPETPVEEKIILETPNVVVSEPVNVPVEPTVSIEKEITKGFNDVTSEYIGISDTEIKTDGTPQRVFSVEANEQLKNNGGQSLTLTNNNQ